MPSLRQQLKRIEWGLLYNFWDSHDIAKAVKNCQEKGVVGIRTQYSGIYIIPPIPAKRVSKVFRCEENY